MTTSLPVSEEKMIDDLAAKYEKEGKKLHIVRGDAAEVRGLSDLMDREKQKATMAARRVTLSLLSCKRSSRKLTSQLERT